MDTTGKQVNSGENVIHIVTFHQVTDALQFEASGKARDEALRLIPVPRAISSSCGLCAKTTLPVDAIKAIIEDDHIDVAAVYKEEGVQYILQFSPEEF